MNNQEFTLDLGDKEGSGIDAGSAIDIPGFAVSRYRLRLLFINLPSLYIYLCRVGWGFFDSGFLTQK